MSPSCALVLRVYLRLAPTSTCLPAHHYPVWLPRLGAAKAALQVWLWHTTGSVLLVPARGTARCVVGRMVTGSSLGVQLHSCWHWSEGRHVLLSMKQLCPPFNTQRNCTTYSFNCTN
jgi:hypothetical protein